MKGLRHRAAAELAWAPGIAGTVALYGLVVATFVLASGVHPRTRLPPVYRVNLVAALGTPPAAAAAAASATPPAAAKPQPPKPAPSRPAPRARTPAVPLKPAPTSRAQPAPAKSAAAATPKPTRSGASQPAGTSTPGPAGNPSGAPGGSNAATIKTEGVEFPFPVYLNNMAEAVYRGFRPPPSNALLEAEVFFYVHRDGSVTGLTFTKRSGSFAFDLEAQGAVEAAARAGAFGVLPAGYGPNVLPVSFYFTPRSAR